MEILLIEQLVLSYFTHAGHTFENSSNPKASCGTAWDLAESLRGHVWASEVYSPLIFVLIFHEHTMNLQIESQHVHAAAMV